MNYMDFSGDCIRCSEQIDGNDTGCSDGYAGRLRAGAKPGYLVAEAWAYRCDSLLYSRSCGMGSLQKTLPEHPVEKNPGLPPSEGTAA